LNLIKSAFDSSKTCRQGVCPLSADHGSIMNAAK
jgi:hypothetical protein